MTVPVQRMSLCPPQCLCIALGTGALLGLAASLSSPVLADPWTISKSIEAGVLFTDNVERNIDDRDAAVLGTVRPEITAKRKGTHTDLAAVAAVDIYETDDSTLNSVFPELGLQTRSRLAGEVVTVDTSWQVNQVPDLGENSRSIGDISLSDENATQYRMSLVPAAEVPITASVLFSSRYALQVSHTSSDTFDDSTDQELSLGVNKPLLDTGYSWGLTGNTLHAASNGDTVLSSESVILSGGKSVSTTLAATAAIGAERVRVAEERNEISRIEADDESATIWDVGLRWEPSERLSLEASYGERVFGRRPRLALRHENKRTAVVLEWTRGFSRERPGLLVPPIGSGAPSSNASIVSGASGSFIPVAGGDLQTPVFTTLQRELVVDESVQLSFSIAGRVTEVTAATRFSSRELVQDRERRERFWLNGISAKRQLSRSVSARATYDYTIGELEGEDESFDEHRVGMTFRVQF